MRGKRERIQKGKTDPKGVRGGGQTRKYPTSIFEKEKGKKKK